MTTSLVSMAKDLVQAHIQAGGVGPHNVHEVLESAYESLAALKTEQPQ